MQELIEWLLERKNKTPQNLHFEKGLHSALDSCINEAKSLLEKEKEVIDEAYLEGFNAAAGGFHFEDEYYNETFKMNREPEFIQINQDNPSTKGSTALVKNFNSEEK